jgi:dTDP-4-amino-4,6-dideoxygalactose transaminase
LNHGDVVIRHHDDVIAPPFTTEATHNFALRAGAELKF